MLFEKADQYSIYIVWFWELNCALCLCLLLYYLLGTFWTCEHSSCEHTGCTDINIDSEENKESTGKCVSDVNLKECIYCCKTFVNC